MNEEEKEAIELLKKDSTDYYYRSIDVRNSVKVALNYISKLQKENEELKAINSMQKYRIEVIDERELISKVIVRNKMKEYLNKA